MYAMNDSVLSGPHKTNREVKPSVLVLALLFLLAALTVTSLLIGRGASTGGLGDLLNLWREDPETARLIFSQVRLPRTLLALLVGASLGLSGAVLNGAKERALDHFIAGRIRFTDMADLVAGALEQLSRRNTLHLPVTLDNVAQLDHLARKAADQIAMDLVT